MTDFQQYEYLKRIVSYALDEMNMNSDELDKAWIFAFRGLGLLNQSVAAEPITVRLPVEGNKTVIYPSDYLSWSKVGIMDEHGKVSTLKVNTALTTFKDNNPNRLSQLTPNINTDFSLLCGSPFFYNYGYNGIYQTLFGTGNGLVQYGECRMDDVNRVIILNPQFKYDSVLLEYLSSPQLNNDYQIQSVFREAVIAFIKWKYKAGSRDEFYAAAIEGRRSLPNKKVTLQQVAGVIREQFGMFIKS